MPVSSSKVKPAHYIICGIWLVLTIAAAIYFINGRLADFDPEQTLSGTDPVSWMQKIREIDQLKGQDLSNTIVHFTSQNCSCTQYSDNHKGEINQRASVEGFNVINVIVSEKVAALVPSTPAILITDQQQKLLYFGPYSAGLACSASNGYVETVLGNYAKGYSASLMVNDTSGCYCHL
ncbi:hypothetical protein DS885_11020 [Psychromonas sp. B3M02]|uniref:DUF6436 domain-containing protein n=1 Tax=Psychromonas sp. B3M02 TaxID=2267226 RepID=UPI000DEAF8B3|nr:DUF6436 domain-containing protein [Psychromonas sp. B3M02]RBW44968.1 hypothetical protein DS885_11020 [Psychromonas sp. B3M02]